jgi:hypothetical protein
MKITPGYIFPGIYISLIVVMWIVVLVFDGGDMEAAWIYSFLLGMPWTFIFRMALAIVGVDVTFVVNILILVSIGINTFLLYKSGTWFRQAVMTGGSSS